MFCGSFEGVIFRLEIGVNFNINVKEVSNGVFGEGFFIIVVFLVIS